MLLFRFLGVTALSVLVGSHSLGKAPVPKDNQPPPEVHVVGVYEGTYPPGVQHRAGFHPDGTVTIKVGEVQKPIILVLTSYEPVVWKVDAPKGAVVRVIASGYHKQTVEGLDEKVPVTLLDVGDKDYFYAHQSEAGLNEGDNEKTETKRKYKRLVERVKGMTMQDIKEFQGKYAGSTFEIK